MSIIWMDGPDHYGSDAALLPGAYLESDVILLTNGGPGGVGTVFGANGVGILRKALPGARAVVAMGTRRLYPSIPNGERSVMEWRDAFNNPIVRLYITSTGALRLAVFDGGLGEKTVALTGPIIIANAWQHIECRVETGGAYVKYSLGVDSIVVSASDAFVTVNAIPQTAQVVPFFGNNNFTTMRDLYIWDGLGALNNSGMQGDRQVVTRYPNADTADNGWAPSSGVLGYPMVNASPPVDANNISANVAALISRFDFGDIDTDITSISAMQIVARMKKSDAGLATVQIGVKSAAATASGAAKAISTQWNSGYSDIFEVDPNTGLKWTPANVNLAKAGLTRTV